MSQELMQDYIGSVPPIINKEEVVDSQDLTNEDASVLRELLDVANKEDLATTLNAIIDVVGRVASIVSGNSSPDLEIEFDAQTGQTSWRIRSDVLKEAAASTDLGTADSQYMVYQRLADTEEGESGGYGFDYVRGVASTEE